MQRDIKNDNWSYGINPLKCIDIDYIDFLIVASNVYSCTEAARFSHSADDASAHNSFTCLLQRQPPDTRAHIVFSLRAFLRLELQRIKTGISWFESKTKILREAVTAYFNDPLYTLN